MTPQKKNYWTLNHKGVLERWSDNPTICAQEGLQEDLCDVKLFREIFRVWWTIGDFA